MFACLAVGVPAWPAVGRAFDATPLIAFAGTFAIAVLVVRIPINVGTLVRTAVTGLILGSIASSFSPGTVLLWAVLLAPLAAVASKRNPSAGRRRQRD
jgi:hypothetical protein